MDALKKFLSKKKTDIKFKNLGEGHKLSDDAKDANRRAAAGPSSGEPHGKRPAAAVSQSEERRLAAAAALARLEKQKKPDANEKERLAARQLAFIKEQARKEIEAEMRMKESGQTPSETVAPTSEVDDGRVIPVPERDIEPGSYAIDGIYYTCPLIGPDVASYHEIEARITEFLLGQPAEELAVTSCLMIHSCNKPVDKVNTCVTILGKYLDNIIDNPENPKVRKIRFANRAYQEKVDAVVGATQYLKAAGFEQSRMKNDDTGEEEDVWYFNPPGDMEAAVAHLIELRDTLKQTTPIRPELDRDLQVLMPAEVKERKELPPDFYQLTAEELKREQRLKTELAERELTLRTKAQREKDELNAQRIYKFCVMRVKFPDGLTLQGTFLANEKVGDLYGFVQENLISEDIEFSLKMPRGEALTQMDSSLNENRLPPASILNFHAENPPAGVASGEVSFLKPELLELVKPLE